MKRLACLLLALALLLPAAASADPEDWVVLSNGAFTLRFPDSMELYSVLEEDFGWNMDVLLDLEGTESTEATVALMVIYAGEDDWKYWMKTGAFPDDTGSSETMKRVTADEPPVDLDTGLDMSYALFRSGDEKRMLEAFIFQSEAGGTDYAVVCRYPANDGGKYSGVFHAILETLAFENVPEPSSSAAPSGTRGSFSVKSRWEYDGYHAVVKDVIVDRTSTNMYWIYAEAPVTNFRVEKLTWNDSTFRVKKAKQLYSKKKLGTQDVISVFDWLPEILPTVRIRAVNADGLEEVWYVSTNEENGDIILLSEEEMAY